MVKEVEFEGKMYRVAEGFIGDRIPCPICETDIIVKEYCKKCGFGMGNAEAHDPKTRLESAQQYVNGLYKNRETHIKDLQKTQGKLEIVVGNGWKPTEIPDLQFSDL